MANGIANNEKEEKKSIKDPAEQSDNSLVCVGGLVQTEKELDVKGSPVKGRKEQLLRGEYVVYKVTDEPVRVPSKSAPVEQKDDGR